MRGTSRVDDGTDLVVIDVEIGTAASEELPWWAMARTHDMGGRPTSDALDLREHTLADWEVLADALSVALGIKGLRTTDEHRRAMEDMPAEDYLSLSYYERWVRGSEQLLVEKGVLTADEIDNKMAELEPTWGTS